LDAVEALRLVQRCYARLNARRPETEKREMYQRGEQPLNYATAEWKKENAARYTDFSDNWCAPVVSAESERIRYTGMQVGDDKRGGRLLHEHWLKNEMEAQSSQGFVTTLATSRSFVIVWGDPSDDEPVVTWEHPSNVEIEYDFVNPRKRVAALKTWVDDTTEFGTLYTPDALWKFQRPRNEAVDANSSQVAQARVRNADNGGWVIREVAGEPWPVSNPMGEVPVVEVQNRPMLAGDPVSEIQGVIPLQDAVNMLWAYLFLSADYASMDARVVLGSAPPMIPIIDQDPTSPKFGQKIGDKPVEMKELREKRLLYLTDKDATIDTFKAATLDIYTDTIEIAVGHIAAQTRTPPTYLSTNKGISNVNGDGLKASEIGLNKKVLEFQTFADPSLREVNRLIALALGNKGLAQEIRVAKVTWMNPEIRSEAQLTDALQKKKAMGYPLEYLMELDGIDPLEIPRILAMKKREDDAAIDFGVQRANESLGELEVIADANTVADSEFSPTSA
jgi:hypothetical protein